MPDVVCFFSCIQSIVMFNDFLYKPCGFSMQFTITHTHEKLSEAVYNLAKEGKRIALVPTMGALHEGHMSLVATARAHADAVVMSIFVNPTQFAPNEDFAQYPRTFEQDVALAKAAGVDVIYAPDVADMYGSSCETIITTGRLGTLLCGKTRPGHFNGVATVVTKLFNRVMPHVAVFGEKDFQQLAVIRQLVDDLDCPIEIVGAPTLRELDGLAMSSRNRYLSADQRKAAAKLYETLRLLSQRLLSGQEVEKTLMEGRSLLKYAGFALDYLELCDSDTLEPQAILQQPARLLVAAVLGSTRLIDNIAVEEEGA